MIANFIAILFLARDQAHKDHLRTKNGEEHRALNAFYDQVIELTDDLAEMYQGRHGIIESIPTLTDEEAGGNPADSLARYLELIEKSRYEAVEKSDTAIQNKIDEIVGLFLSTNYKLRNLK